MCDPITAAIIATVTTGAVAKMYADDQASKAEGDFKASMKKQQEMADKQKTTFEEKIAAMEDDSNNPLLVSNQYQRGAMKGIDKLRVKRTAPTQSSVGGMTGGTGVNIAS